MDLHIKELDLELINPNKSNFQNSTIGGNKIVIIGKPGCYRKNTEILMFDGATKYVQDVRIGDVIMGNDGTPRNVLELFHDIDEMYKILPQKGDPYSVNKKHDLVLMCTGYHNIPRGHIEIISVDDYMKKSDGWKKRFKLFRSQGVEWDEKIVDIDPYLLGSFLGDTTSFGLEDTFCDALRRYNVCNHKHIPFDYKINSKDNRLRLLAGIIDTTMEVNRNHRGFNMILKNEGLLDDIIFVARSLGFSANKNKGKHSTFHCFIDGDTIDEIPIKIPKNIQKKSNKHHLMTSFTVEYENIDEYFGFRLDGNHLFLLSSFHVVKNTGKSTLITSLLYEKRDIFPMFMVMSGTEDSNGHYKKIIPSTFVYNKLDEKKIEDFIVRQKIAKKHLENPWAVLLLDDCTDDPKIFNKPLMQGIFKNGRHWKMLFILSLQYCMDVKPVIRTNVDGVFILRETNLRNRKNLWENYAGIIPDFSMFCQIMDTITSDYTALYIHNQTTSNKLEDCLFWYKAKPPPENFRLGSIDLWKFHKSRYNPEHKEKFY